MALPSASDINVHDSLDEIKAYGVFFGKSLEEAELLFRENAILCTECLVHMGPKAALFYSQALLSYLCSTSSRGDVDAACGLTSVVEALVESGQDIEPLRADMVRALRRIREHFAFYANDPAAARAFRHVPEAAGHALSLLATR